MSAFVIANISIKDINKWEKYASQAPDTIKSHGGEIIFKGKAVDILAGSHGFDICVIMKFASRATVDSWYLSQEYQELIKIRDESASVNMVVYTDN